MTDDTQTPESESQPEPTPEPTPKAKPSKKKTGQPTGKGAKTSTAKGRQTVKAPLDQKEPPKQQAPAKATAQREPTVSDFVDGLMMKGITWEELVKKSKAEAEKRGQKQFRSIGQLKAHARARAKSAKWTVTMDDKKVKMTAVK